MLPPQTITPEIIEAIQADDFKSLSNLAAELHQATIGVLDTFNHSPKELEREEEIRTTLCLKLDESQAELSKKIADLRALKKSLEIAEGWASADRARIRSAKISHYSSMKYGTA